MADTKEMLSIYLLKDEFHIIFFIVHIITYLVYYVNAAIILLARVVM